MEKVSERNIYEYEFKYELKSMRDWSDLKAFNSVDSHRQGYIDYNSIMNFCRMNGFRAAE